MTLEELAIKYGSDKYYSHSYVPLYEQLFNGRTVKRLCEIGIGFEHLMSPFTPKFVAGSSLRMWAEYLPEAEIYACDIRPETLINEGRIHSIIADQSSARDLAQLLCFANGSFDVIIDDGSHKTADQIFTAQYLIPTMSEGGIYVVEDVQEPAVVAAAIGGTIHRFNKRPDDCLVVVSV